MAKTITVAGYANVDPTTGTLNVDLRAQPNASGFFNVDVAPNQLASATPSTAPTAAIVTVASAPGGARFVKYTLVPTSGGESAVSPETAAGTAAGGQGVQVTSPLAAGTAGYVGWNVYVGATSGSETKQNGGTPIAIGTNWTEPSGGLVGGAAMPSSDTSALVQGAVTVTITQ